MSDFASTERTLLVSELALMKERDDLRAKLASAQVALNDACAECDAVREERDEATFDGAVWKQERDNAIAENARLSAAAEEVFLAIERGLEGALAVDGRTKTVARLRRDFERRARGSETTEGGTTT